MELSCHSTADETRKIRLGLIGLIVLFSLLGPGCGFHKSVNTGSKEGEGGTIIEKTEIQELEDLLGAGTEEALIELAERVNEENVNLTYDYSEKYGLSVTLLMVAADWLQPASLRFLIEVGADNTIQDANGRDAFWYAENAAEERLVTSNSERFERCVEVLPESKVEAIRDALVEYESAEFASDFHEAMSTALMENDHETVVRLLKKVTDDYGLFPELSSSCRAPLDLEDLEEFSQSMKAIEGPAPVEELNGLLIAAVRAGDQSSIESLITEGADLDHLTDEEGMTALMIALAEQQWAIVQFLIQVASGEREGSLDLNVRSVLDETALSLTKRLAETADARAKRRYMRFAQFIERFGGGE
ncbi:MAG: ankyrin repeat domain-containing protein [Pseudomonadota bacterium]